MFNLTLNTEKLKLLSPLQINYVESRVMMLQKRWFAKPFDIWAIQNNYFPEQMPTRGPTSVFQLNRYFFSPWSIPDSEREHIYRYDFESKYLKHPKARKWILRSKVDFDPIKIINRFKCLPTDLYRK